MRSSSDVWGLPWVSWRQSEQLRIGAQLLFSLVWLLAEHLRAGTGGWLEHPAPPTWAPKAPSSFLWRPVQALAAAPCAATTIFDQCEHQDCSLCPSSFGRAPTCMLSIRMPSLPAMLRATPGEGRCSHGAGVHTTLLGKTESGAFRTASKKTYPAGLCKALATAIVDSVHAITSGEVDQGGETLHYTEDEEDIRASLDEFYVPLDRDAPEVSTPAPDFAGVSRSGRVRSDPESYRFLDSESESEEEELHGDAQAPPSLSRCADCVTSEALSCRISTERAHATNCSCPSDASVRDPPSPSEPPDWVWSDAQAEQEVADQLFGSATEQAASWPLVSSPPLPAPPPPPPAPLPLSSSQQARVAANRAEARLRRAARHRQRVAPWGDQAPACPGLFSSPPQVPGAGEAEAARAALQSWLESSS